MPLPQVPKCCVSPPALAAASPMATAICVGFSPTMLPAAAAAAEQPYNDVGWKPRRRNSGSCCRPESDSRSKTSRPTQTAATRSAPVAPAPSAMASAAGRMQAVGCENPVSSKSSRCASAPLAHAAETALVRRLDPRYYASAVPPCACVISRMMRPAGSTAAASATPAQSRICRLVAAIASVLMSGMRVLLANAERTAVASMSVPPAPARAVAFLRVLPRRAHLPQEVSLLHSGPDDRILASSRAAYHHLAPIAVRLSSRPIRASVFLVSGRDRHAKADRTIRTGTRSDYLRLGTDPGIGKRVRWTAWARGRAGVVARGRLSSVQRHS